MGQTWRAGLAGAAAGAVNGFFGSGGGMVFLPLMAGARLPRRQLYPTCVGVILPACALSAAVYFLRGGISPAQAAPYLAGGLAGGALGGRLYDRVPTGLLRWSSLALLVYGGVRYLL
jgi:uncharacterized protein